MGCLCAVREIEKGCKVTNARCSPKRDHLAPILLRKLPQIISYKINCSCFRLFGRKEQRFTLTSMVEFAVLGLQNPAGAKRPVTFSLFGRVRNLHANFSTGNSTKSFQRHESSEVIHPPPSPLIPLPTKPYLQGTRPFGRSYYNVHS
jgi:hypothetical protein